MWMFPPNSPLHQMLFLPLFPREFYASQPQIAPNAFIPSNEVYLEGLENIWMRMSSGGLYSRGVLLLTSHRIIFIQYPSQPKEESSHSFSPSNDSNSFLVTIPICLVSTISLRRRWKERFHTLGLICKNQIGYLFVSSRDEDEFITLRAFRRMKSEIQWRKEEDLFSTGIDWKPCPQSHLIPVESITKPPSVVFDIPQGNLSDKTKRILKPFTLSEEYTRFVQSLLSLATSDFGRMGIDRFPQWRRSNVNHLFTLCRSYPQDLVVPSKISDQHLTLASNQRSSKRLPVLTWIHPITGAALCRSLRLFSLIFL